MSDFTLHKDIERRNRYINRHIKNEYKFWEFKPENLLTSSFWARYHLWQYP